MRPPIARRSRFSARLLLLLPLWTAAALGAGGCDGGHHAGPAGPAGAPGAAVPRRGGTIVTGWTAEPLAVNELIVPATNAQQEMILQLFLRLLREEPDFERHPAT